MIAKWVGAGEIHSALFTDGRYSHEVFPRLPRHFSTGFHPIADKSWKMALAGIYAGRCRHGVRARQSAPFRMALTTDIGEGANERRLSSWSENHAYPPYPHPRHVALHEREAGPQGHERGREYFTITRHADGRRSLRTYNEIDDAPNVMRDVTLSVGADWRPIDCFVRLSVGDAFMGSRWYQFPESEALCERYTVNEGRISQRIALKAPIDSFGTHPMQGDGWLMKIVSQEQPGVPTGNTTS